MVDVDANRIVQVVGNLLHNAVKFTEQGGRITVSTLGVDEQAVLKVKDNGFGIPADELERVFDMFTQVAEHQELATSRGLGIGLGIARRLIEAHGGSIHAESAGRGHGSEFVVRLPLHRAAPS